MIIQPHTVDTDASGRPLEPGAGRCVDNGSFYATAWRPMMPRTRGNFTPRQMRAIAEDCRTIAQQYAALAERWQLKAAANPSKHRGTLPPAIALQTLADNWPDITGVAVGRLGDALSPLKIYTMPYIVKGQVSRGVYLASGASFEMPHFEGDPWEDNPRSALPISARFDGHPHLSSSNEYCWGGMVPRVLERAADASNARAYIGALMRFARTYSEATAYHRSSWVGAAWKHYRERLAFPSAFDCMGWDGTSAYDVRRGSDSGEVVDIARTLFGSRAVHDVAMHLLSEHFSSDDVHSAGRARRLAQDAIRLGQIERPSAHGSWANCRTSLSRHSTWCTRCFRAKDNCLCDLEVLSHGSYQVIIYGTVSSRFCEDCAEEHVQLVGQRLSLCATRGIGEAFVMGCPIGQRREGTLRHPITDLCTFTRDDFAMLPTFTGAYRLIPREQVVAVDNNSDGDEYEEDGDGDEYEEDDDDD